MLTIQQFLVEKLAHMYRVANIADIGKTLKYLQGEIVGQGQNRETRQKNYEGAFVNLQVAR